MQARFWPHLAVLCLTAPAAHAITADELVAKNIEAHGGAGRIQAIHTLRLEGRLVVGGGFELAATTVRKAPDKVRNEAMLQGLTMVQSYDGKDAWQIQPFGGRRDPEKLSADDARVLADSADLVNPLVDWKARGSRLDYLGTEDVDGTPAHKLKVTRRNGDVTYVYLDPDYFLEIRTVDNRKVRGVEEEVETDLGDYEKVDGVYLPFSISTGPKGSTQKQKMVIEKAAANVDVDDALFAFPAGAKP